MREFNGELTDRESGGFGRWEENRVAGKGCNACESALRDGQERKG